MADAKTQPTAVAVDAFLAEVADEKRRADAQTLCDLLKGATGLEPVMWGASIVGFGRYHYRYDSGREGDAPLVGFSPRKANLVLYVALEDDREGLLARLGKHKTGAGCVYLNRLSDADPDVIAEMARTSVRNLNARYPA